jgi:hypothetical protein
LPLLLPPPLLPLLLLLLLPLLPFLPLPLTPRMSLVVDTHLPLKWRLRICIL